MEYLDQSAIYEGAISFLLTRVSRRTHSSMLYFFSHDYWQNPSIKDLFLTQDEGGLLKATLFWPGPLRNQGY